MVVISVVDGLVGFVTIFVSKCNFHQSFSRLVVQLVGHLLLVKFNPKPLCIASYQTPHIQSWFNRVQSSELNIYKTQRPTLDVDLLIFRWRDKTLLNSITFTWKTMSWSCFNFDFTGASTLRNRSLFIIDQALIDVTGLSCWHHVGSVTSFWTKQRDLNIHQRQLVKVLLLRGLNIEI